MKFLRGLFGVVCVFVAVGLLIFVHQNYTALEIDLGVFAPMALLIVGFCLVMFGLITFLNATR